jgi:hypothetical protein
LAVAPAIRGARRFGARMLPSRARAVVPYRVALHRIRRPSMCLVPATPRL